MILGPLLVSLANRLLDRQFQTEWLAQRAEPTITAQNECVPAVDQAAFAALENLDLSQEANPTASRRMAEMFLSDQAARELPGGINSPKLNEEDTLRRIEALGYITGGQIHTARDLFYAAFIFQHGDCPEHYRFANQMAQIALDAGYAEARWIYAATLDRYLMSLGELQKFGTQYTWIDGEFKLYPVDPTTTDAERAEYDVPPLSEALDRKPTTSGGGVARMQWLETWWLTLIGAAFAGLSAIIALVDAKVNAPHGWGVLIMALALLVASASGHYTQMMALSQGTAETQSAIWSIVNGLLVIIWLAFIGSEIYWVVKRKPLAQASSIEK